MEKLTVLVAFVFYILATLILVLSLVGMLYFLFDDRYTWFNLGIKLVNKLTE